MNIKILFKRRLLVLLVFIATALSSVLGQVPNGMKYQAVVRDTWGRIIENKTVGVEIKILQLTEDGDAIFIEEHQKTTNEYGLIYLVIGSINQIDFSNIDWSNGPYFIEIGIDIDGGHAYEQYGTSELLSVPYALYALHAQTAENGGSDTLFINEGGGFIANVVDDYGAIGDGSTNDTEAFVKAFSENTDVFVPNSDNTYILSSLNIPEEKRIWFERGAIMEIFGSITGNNTEIIAGDYQIFTTDSQVAGTWKSGIAYDSWFGNNQQIPGMAAMVTSSDTTRWGTQIPVLDSAYSEAWDESLEVATRNAIYDKIQSLEITGGSSFIANVVDDYAAVGDGSTDNAQAFANAFNENNDVFIPFSDNNYLVSNLSIPSGKRLWFEMGAIIDVSGTLSGDTTEIIAGDFQLFTTSSTLTGSWKGGIAYDSWFGNNQQIPEMNAMVTSADTTRWGTQIPVLDSAYSEAWDESQEVATRNAIYDKIQSLEITGGSSFIANVVDDYAAVGDGSTDNTQAFENAFNENNDIFIPQADSTYLISSITIPQGKRLWFEKGAMIDVTGTLTGNSTEIIAGEYMLFTSTSNLEGTWKGGIAYNCWLGNDCEIPGMNAMITPADTTRWGIDTFGSGSFIANVVDYGAVSDGITDNVEPFEEALLENNDIFIPGGDSTYLISSLVLPKDKRLWFETGSKIDITGTLTGDSTEIMAGDQALFTSTSNLEGTWKGGISYDSWSGKNAQIHGMVSMVSPDDTTRWGIDTYGAGSFIANIIDYGAVGDGTTNDSAAFSQALAENNAVFIPNTGYNYKISKGLIPSNKQIWFENGAILDVTDELIIEGEIIAGLHQIFNINSSDKINGLKAKIEKALPEWFGAKGDSSTQCVQAAQACLNVFNRVDLTGRDYIFNDTIAIPFEGEMYGTANTQLTLQGNRNFLKIRYPKFHIEGLEIHTDATNRSFVIDMPAIRMNDPTHRLSREGGVLRDIKILGYNVLGELHGLSTNGIRAVQQNQDDFLYNVVMDNIYIRSSDTAFYVRGYSAPQTAGMYNSWKYYGFTVDMTARGVVLGENAFDHQFYGLMLQPRTVGVDAPLLDISGQKCVIIGSFWDTQYEQTIVLRSSSAHNNINLGVQNMERYVVDNGEANTYNNSYGFIYEGSVIKYVTERTTDLIIGDTTYGVTPAINNLDIVLGGKTYVTEDFHLPDRSRIVTVAPGESATGIRLYSQSSSLLRLFDATDEYYNFKTTDFYPSGTSNTVNLGTSSKRWNMFYSKCIADNGEIVSIDDVLKLKPRSSTPANPSEGMIYVNSSNHHIYCYLGGNWKQLD